MVSCILLYSHIFNMIYGPSIFHESLYHERHVPCKCSVMIVMNQRGSADVTRWNNFWELTTAAATPIAIWSLVLQFKGVFSGSEQENIHDRRKKEKKERKRETIKNICCKNYQTDDLLSFLFPCFQKLGTWNGTK